MGVRPGSGGSPDLQAQHSVRMENFFALNEIPDNDIATKGTEVGLPTVGTVFLGVFVTLLPKLVPRLMVMMSPERKSKFSDPAFLPEGEKMFREKFSENLQMWRTSSPPSGTKTNWRNQRQRPPASRNSCSAL